MAAVNGAECVQERRCQTKAPLATAGALKGAVARDETDPSVDHEATSFLCVQPSQACTVLDDSALGFETMFCSAGRRGLEVELAPADLVTLTAAVTAPIGRAG